MNEPRITQPAPMTGVSYKGPSRTGVRHGVEVLGIEKLLAKLDKKKKSHGRGVEAGLKLAALHLLRKSMEVVPIDTGLLRSTGHVRQVSSGFNTIMYVGYGTDYGIYVHENLEAQHAEGKQAKFLTEPANRERSIMMYIIQREINKAV